MRKIREVLRLSWCAQLSPTVVAQSCSMRCTTVREYLQRAERAGLSWSEAEGMSDSALEERLFSCATLLKDPVRPLPDWAEVHKQYQRKGVTLLLLWEEYTECFMRTKSISLLLQVTLISVVLTGCGGSNLSLVKNGILEFDESVTVGGALEGYKYFDDYAWSEIVDSQGRELVEFRGYFDSDKVVDVVAKMTEETVEGAKNRLGTKGNLNYLVRFAINKNGKTFEVMYHGYEMRITNRETGEFENIELPSLCEENFQDIYSNRPDRFTSDLNQVSDPKRIQSNESQVIDNLRTLVGAQVAFAAAERGYSDDFEKLTAPNQGLAYLDIDLSVPFNGYKYTLQRVGKTITSSSGMDVFTNFECVAVPVEKGRTGNHGFFVDASGVIRFTMDGSAPDKTSSPI